MREGLTIQMHTQLNNTTYKKLIHTINANLIVSALKPDSPLVVRHLLGRQWAKSSAIYIRHTVDTNSHLIIEGVDIFLGLSLSSQTQTCPQGEHRTLTNQWLEWEVNNNTTP